MDAPRTFHLHMISDATGETLVAIAKAVRVQYAQVRAIEHMHPLVRSKRELERVLKDVEATPGHRALHHRQSGACRGARADLQAAERSLRAGAEKPILQVFESYLGTPSTPTVAGQHVLDADYFRRIEALNFTMLHDDGHLPENLDDADILLVGISRTSKTPTSIYLANRGFKTANVPLVPGVPLPPKLEAPHQRLRRRPGGERRAHLASPPEPRAGACRLASRRLCRPRGDRRRNRRDAAALRPARLADDRRDAPLHRGDRGGDPAPLSRPRSAGARMSGAHE